jgi:hypothetical protein
MAYNPLPATSTFDGTYRRRSTGALLFWPVLLTFAVSAVRVAGELQGWVTARSGGAGALLGITWLAFAFGGWFGVQLAHDGDRPALRRAPLFGLVSLAVVVAVVMWRFGPIMRSTETVPMADLRIAVMIIAGTTLVLSLLQFAVWPRLAWTLLCYGLAARLGVLAITWLAKVQGWDTHYTKFGPQGLEVPLGETMASAAFAQLGFWVPFTVIAGGFVGGLFGGRRRVS